MRRKQNTVAYDSMTCSFPGRSKAPDLVPHCHLRCLPGRKSMGVAFKLTPGHTSTISFENSDTYAAT